MRPFGSPTRYINDEALFFVDIFWQLLYEIEFVYYHNEVLLIKILSNR